MTRKYFEREIQSLTRVRDNALIWAKSEAAQGHSNAATNFKACSDNITSHIDWLNQHPVMQQPKSQAEPMGDHNTNA